MYLHGIRRVVKADVRDADVVDIDACIRRIGGLDQKPARRARYGDVGDGHVADGSATNADAERTDGAPQHAVGDGHVLAGGMSSQHLFVPAQGDGVVTRLNVAVGDHHVLAAVDVDAVGVGSVTRVADEQFFKDCVLTADEIAAPAGRVADGDAADQHVLALAEDQQLAWAQHLLVAREADAPGPSVVVAQRRVLDRRLEEEIAAAVDGAPPRDGDILPADGDDEVCASPLLDLAAPVLGILVQRVVVVQVLAGDQHRAWLQMQVNVVLEAQRARHKSARRHDDLPAPLRRHRVNGLLYRVCVERRAIRDGSEIKNVCHS